MILDNWFSSKEEVVFSIGDKIAELQFSIQVSPQAKDASGVKKSEAQSAKP